MVDFQSRDTSRGISDDDDEDDEEGDDAAETRDAAAGASPKETEPDPDDDDESADTDAPPDQPSPDESRETDPLAPDAPVGSTAADDGEAEASVETTEPDSPMDVQGEAADHGRARGSATAEEHGHSHGDDGHGDHDHGDHDHGDGDGGHEHAEHGHAHAHGAEVGQLGVAVVTVSSTRSRDTDASGDAIAAAIEEADHEIVTRDVVGDDLDGIQRTVLALTGREDVDVLVTTGGTGVTPDDVTVEAVEPLFDKDLPGFGELFRILSYEEVGTRALSSRATAGVSEGVPVFCLPGSEAAVSLGMDELVTAEMEHLVAMTTRED